MAGSAELLLKQKRIFFLFGSFDLGGAELQGLLLADYLRMTYKADVHIWALNPLPGRLSTLCDELGIPWHGIRFHWGLSRRWYYFPKAVAALKAERPEILISYTCVPNLVCALSRQLVGANLCVWNQADEGLLLNRLPLHRLAVRQPQCFISNSSGGKNFLRDTYDIPANRIHLIHNGVTLKPPLKDPQNWRKQMMVDSDALIVCMLANLSRHKDHISLLTAWRDVLKYGQYSVLPVLVLAGRDDGTGNNLQQLIEKLEIVDSVRLLGKVDDVSGLLAAIDLFAYSSRSEGIPNAILEAMATGLPVVGTDIPGIREAVGPEGAVFLAHAGDHAEMASKIMTLLGDTNLRKRYGTALRERAISEFSMERMCTASVQVISDALAATISKKNSGNQ